jgi:hypothetical protein
VAASARVNGHRAAVVVVVVVVVVVRRREFELAASDGSNLDWVVLFAHSF